MPRTTDLDECSLPGLSLLRRYKVVVVLDRGGSELVDLSLHECELVDLSGRDGHVDSER